MPLPAAPTAVCGARPVTLVEVLEPGHAVSETSRAVAGQPQATVGVDERFEFGSQLLTAGVGHRGQPAVGPEAGAGVAAHERHQLGARGELLDDEAAVGPAGSGPPET